MSASGFIGKIKKYINFVQDLTGILLVNYKGREVRSLAEGLVAAKVAQGLRLPAGRRAPALGPGYPGLLEPKSAQQMDRPRFG